MLDMLLGPLGGVLAVLVALAGAWLTGRRSAAQKAENRDLKGYVETRKKADEADIVGDDPDAARRWLRERAKRGRDL